jgi:hypothetical protein
VCECFLDVHFEDVGDGFSLEADVEGFAVEAFAFAVGAGDPDIGEEVHFEAFGAVALTGFAASARDIEGEASGGVSAGLGVGEFGVEIADEVEELDVCGGVGARGATDGGLIDIDDFIDEIDAIDAVMITWGCFGVMEFAFEGEAEDVVDE